MQKVIGLGGAAQGVGSAVETVAEVYSVNKTKAELAQREQAMSALDQFGTEFSTSANHWFDSFINGLNRLPRPVMALGTVGLFIFAMANPEGFIGRMEGLAYVPEPLWWLLGAVVSFYFGARELHYARRPSAERKPIFPTRQNNGSKLPEKHPENAALSEWVSLTNN